MAENTFATAGLVDYSGPVLRLGNLSPEDMYVLLTKIRHVFANGDVSAYLVPDDALESFMRHCAARVGDAYFRAPRTTIKEFVNLLAVLEQNPGVNWLDLVGNVDIATEANPDLAPLEDEAATGSLLAPPISTPSTSLPPPAKTNGDDELTNLKL